MPGRKIPLVIGEVYHLLNRGVEHRPIFSSIRDYRRLIKTMDFYRFSSPLIRLFQFLEFSKEGKREILERLSQKKQKVGRNNLFLLNAQSLSFSLETING